MQFRDLHTQYEELKEEIDKGISEVIQNTNFILGEPVTRLENKLAEYVGSKYCVTCANGTDALQLSLMALDIKKGDAVFTSDFTYFASAGCASILGATPVFVDIDLGTFNISPEALEKEINRVISEGHLVPKVIIPVDLFGQPSDYSSIIPIAKKYGLYILEDGAQGFGGEINKKKACSFGDISITSFFPAKPLGCYGDGGAIFTDSEDVNVRLRSLRAQGKSPTDKYDNLEIGINSRLDTLQAAILLPKLSAFEKYELNRVNEVASWYSERLKNVCVVPKVKEGFLSSWAQYTILLKDRNQRELIQHKLKKSDIPSMVYYPRGLHQQQAYKSLNIKDENYINTIEATNRVLSLPMHPYMDEEMVNTIVKNIID